MALYLGTGGFSNEDWVGLFYPESLKKTEWIGHYAAHFNAVEINSSFYGVPGQKTFAGMLQRAGKNTERPLRFTVKLHQSFTHQITANADDAARFCYSLEPLLEAQALGPLLAQFPYAFKNTVQNRAYLADLVAWFAPHTLALEFRHDGWDKRAVVQYLGDLGAVAVSVDLPALPGLPAPVLHDTAPDAPLYLRLHGRNATNWFEAKDAAARHDYQYTSQELLPWVQAIKKTAGCSKDAYVFFENTTRGQGLTNAQEFLDLWKA